MPIAQSKLTAQGQISVPAEVRKRLGLGPGSVIEWEERDGEMVVRRSGRFSSAEIHRVLFPDGPPARLSAKEMKESIARRGTFVAMEQTYNTYKQIKIQEQDLDEMATGFNNEVAPTVMEASGRVFRLSGGLDAQYNEWRTILREIFALETGLPPAS